MSRSESSPRADHPTAEAYRCAAWFLRCEAAALRAVAEVEAGREGAFLSTGEPVILFERHRFSLMTQGRFDGKMIPGAPAAVSVVSAPTRGGYGPASLQHRKLQAAIQLDRDAALKACSWGLFQILGSNYDLAGYSSVQRFVTAMYREVDDHLRALVMFIRRDPRLLDALRAKDWAVFARYYNGPKYATHSYDKRMAEAYRRAVA